MVGIRIALFGGRAEPSGGGRLARGPVSAASWAELTPEGQQRQGVGVADRQPLGERYRVGRRRAAGVSRLFDGDQQPAYAGRSPVG
jgi:hypothetical protein